MAQLIALVIDEAYRLCTETGGGAKHYRRGVEPEVDRAIERLRDQAARRVAVLARRGERAVRRGEYRLAERAQRHAVPILEDLIGAVRTDQVRDMFDSLKLAETSEKASQIFERYIADLIRRFPTLNAPTQLDFGPARIIVLDLQYVAPTGSAAANRQTEMMYLLARHILARNFFLHPEYLAFVPERVQELSPPALHRDLRDGQARRLRRVAPHAGQPACPRAGRARCSRGPQAQRPARLRQPAPVRYGRRRHCAIDGPVRARRR